MANSNVTIRMDADLKKRADALFDELGLSFTAAVTMFVKQSLRDGALPFVPSTKAQPVKTESGYVYEVVEL